MKKSKSVFKTFWCNLKSDDGDDDDDDGDDDDGVIDGNAFLACALIVSSVGAVAAGRGLHQPQATPVPFHCTSPAWQ